MQHAPLLLIVLLFGCSETPSTGSLSEVELQKVETVLQTYVEGWKAMDSSIILGLFTEDAVLSPSGLFPKEGKQALRDFWFPDDGSVTEIHEYDIEVLDSGGSGDLAFTYEKGSLSYTYTRGDMSVTQESQAFGATLYRRDSEGTWKIFRRMWSDIRVER